MSITFINSYRLLVTLLLLALVVALYAWLVRPKLRDRPEFDWFYARADGYWLALWAWIKVRWDMALGSAMVAAPLAYGFVLDTVVNASILLADILPAFAGVDLSDWILPAWVKTVIQVGGVVFPVIRARLVKSEAE